jgi:uncharacterized UBP type Zn finger protein
MYYTSYCHTLVHNTQYIIHSNFILSYSHTLLLAGQYELHSIVTHKGRSADSGHYIGWARQEPGSDYWWKYDDEVVTETTTEEVMKLKGGGDRDIAYLMFYRFKDFKSL